MGENLLGENLLVLPIVLYLKGGQPGGPQRRTYELEIFGEKLMSFTYWQPSPAHHKLACMTRIARSGSPLSQAQRYLLLNCVETYVQLDEMQERELQEMLAKKGYRDVLEIYDSGVTWADRMREKALTEAREQGLSEGRAEGLAGQRRLVLRQLELRFGPLPAVARERVQGLASPEALETLGEELLTADSLADLGLA